MSINRQSSNITTRVRCNAILIYHNFSVKFRNFVHMLCLLKRNITSPAATQHSRCVRYVHACRRLAKWPNVVLLAVTESQFVHFHHLFSYFSRTGHFRGPGPVCEPERSSPPTGRGVYGIRMQEKVTATHPTAHTLPGSMPHSAYYRDLCL